MSVLELIGYIVAFVAGGALAIMTIQAFVNKRRKL